MRYARLSRGVGATETIPEVVNPHARSARVARRDDPRRDGGAPVNGDPRLRFPTGFGQIKPRVDRGDQRGFSALGVWMVPSWLVNSKHAYSFREILKTLLVKSVFFRA